jgi:hypothetical protein
MAADPALKLKSSRDMESSFSGDEIEKTIRHVLGTFSQFATPSGLFKTFRIDYSESECPKGFIDESRATFIDTKYDHSFILEILTKLRNYFPCEKDFIEIAKKGVKNIFGDAVLSPSVDGRVKTLQWRYYNIDHQGRGKILPDIDDTARNLIAIERLRELCDDDLFPKDMAYLNDLSKQVHNYIQFWPQLTPLSSDFKPSPHTAETRHRGLLTYFGNKKDNDVDPVCNITPIYSSLLFFNKNFDRIEYSDVESIRTVLSYLERFLHNSNHEYAHEYYEPMFVYYNYAKLIELSRMLRPELRQLAALGDARARLVQLITRKLGLGWENPLEAGFAVTSLIILNYRGAEIKEGIKYILQTRNNDHWDAYRFYKQRHPHRIFGSRGLTTAVCLEAISYWRNLCPA